MTTHRAFQIFAYFATVVIALISLPSQSFGADAVRAVRSLTVAERANLPDNTSVKLPGGRTFTLGQLREQHRARLAGFSRAGLWGKRFADKLPKPTSLKGLLTNAQSGQPAAGATVVGNGVLQTQNPSALGQSGGGIQNTPVAKTNATSSGQPQKPNVGTGGGIQNNSATTTLAGTKTAATPAGQKTSSSNAGGSSSSGGGIQLQPNSALGGSGGGNGKGVVNGVQVNTAPPVPSPGVAKLAATGVASSDLFLVPRQGFPGVPTPADYLAFCNAAQASACLYLPPNAIIDTFSDFPNLAQAIPDVAGSDDRFVLTVDFMMTDAGACKGYGGIFMNDYQACAFVYFFAQQTKFKPAGHPASAASCDPGLDYQVDPKAGSILVKDPTPIPVDFQLLTEASPSTCVVQVWLYP